MTRRKAAEIKAAADSPYQRALTPGEEAAIRLAVRWVQGVPTHHRGARWFIDFSIKHVSVIVAPSGTPTHADVERVIQDEHAQIRADEEARAKEIKP